MTNEAISLALVYTACILHQSVTR